MHISKFNSECMNIPLWSRYKNVQQIKETQISKKIPTDVNVFHYEKGLNSKLKPDTKIINLSKITLY